MAGAHLSGGRQAMARQLWLAHMQARDTLAAMIRASGGTPVTTQAFYELPFPVHDAASAVQLAAHLEDGVTAAYLAVVATEQRMFGAITMQVAAGRAATWRGTTIPFPGLVVAAD